MHSSYENAESDKIFGSTSFQFVVKVPLNHPVCVGFASM